MPLQRVILLLNEKGMTRETKAYLLRAKAEHRFTPCAGRAKSYLVVRERGREQIVASPISSATLQKRWREAARTPAQLAAPFAERAACKKSIRTTGKG